MIKLLNTLYVLSEDAYLSLDNENVVVTKSGVEAGRFPLHTLNAIEYFGYKGASPSLIGECAARGIDLGFFTPHGRFLARTVGEERGNVLLRQEQYRISDDEDRSLTIAQNMIAAKVFNARWVIERAIRDHPLQVNADDMRKCSRELADYSRNARTANSMEELRGIEGLAARCYFQRFGSLIFVSDKAMGFGGRSRRPPLDAPNAMLSFAYSLLAADCASALEGVGLDPYIGLMHAERPGRKSLALDLVEELRAPFADRIVLTCINNRIVGSGGFEHRQDGSYFFSDNGRRKFLDAWQKKKREVIRHPFLDVKVAWGLVPHVQAMLLARFIRGDIEGYPPFMWK